MFAMCQPEFPLHPQLGEAQGNSQQDVIYHNKKDSHPDKNLNFMDEKSSDSNENWSQPISKVPIPEEWEQWNDNGIKKVSENLTDLIPRQKAKNRSRGISQNLKSDDNFLGLEEEKDREEEDIRRPPEGAEVRSPEQETNYQVKVKVRGKLASSPREDNDYSSSRWVDNPESDGTKVWKIPSVTDEDGTCNATQQASNDDFDSSSSSSETVSPALAEAFRNMQEMKKFKELEKQKYHSHLVMYRRLALLRWIRSLQQNVADQQNRLQESFDTILDNRKELIQQVKQGMVHTENPT
ncbi:UPF0500 protein C1orf216 homolog [Pantherophis guttatus]|uniref:UPF0500 protein C1orf216 homolog n=1 Tax=Pantherophis guttatus TaxID=94885 RepID=A0A6P9BGT8_PANGU|nr:UPF0500 protein C1orf216 homolog [Pantherophis guttatus]XP_034269315.1 UPF0500 protein C1orf216 homolog [Pantherophis guttatus]XP_034269316.1 UPF0500 protein C1orf216 homolog [Pantherophis guttatus]XP_034269317.1 UPF0500 protein C1orf216 homolog [Pantherophis guttatus]